MHPCGFYGKAFGNLKDQDFIDIWNGEQYLELRRSLARVELHGKCDICNPHGCDNMERKGRINEGGGKIGPNRPASKRRDLCLADFMTAAKVITCFLFVLPLAGCGKEYGELDRLDLTIAGPTSRRLSAFAAFRAAEGKLLTVDRYFNGEKQGETSRTLRLQDPSTNMWRAYDATGNWIEFRQTRKKGSSSSACTARDTGAG
jgi:hypothetical protein